MNDKVNPANDTQVSEIPEGYIPMSAPTRRLQVPAKAGFVRYWFRGDPGRIQRAMQAGYQFVDPKDVKVNSFDLGGDAKTSGNTDMGSRVSISSGDDGGAEGGGRLYLMEIPQHLYEHSQTLLQETNNRVARALTAGLIGSDDESFADKKARYTNQVPDFFNPHKRRR